jgi:hypothetical protein
MDGNQHTQGSQQQSFFTIAFLGSHGRTTAMALNSK